ncbi:MAG: tetratricopeptide repeat protein, partial [Planctomycetota bacterium]
DPNYKTYPSLAQRFYELASEGQFRNATQVCQQAIRANTHYIREAEFNNAGYALMRSGRNAASEAAMKVNVQHFPNSWNAWDSYADALAATGKTQQAIEAYAHSIRLNPKNAAGQKRIQELRDRQREEGR